MVGKRFEYVGFVLTAGRARSFRNAFIPGSSSSTTPARTRMKSAAAAMTPSYLRRASSSETPTHTWSGQYQVISVWISSFNGELALRQTFGNIEKCLIGISD